ncbi:hypothetical protein [Shewanella sp. GXUN23E]|uniref:hypothetical protein n=1 Tax=Shewanella sp. GXUN23E TaxID=3422498 RepID=UPI003D7C4896
MENDYALMTVITVFVICVSASEMFKIWMKSRNAYTRSGIGKADKTQVEQLTSENAQLKARIATLEKIVIDPAYQLGQQIKNLK